MSVTDEDARFYEENGYVHIPNFLTPEEVAALKEDIKEAIDSAIIPDVVQSHLENLGTKQMLESLDKNHIFFENKSVKDGKLAHPLHLAVHKIGHGAHIHSKGAKSLTFSEKMKTTIKKLTGFDHPLVIQGMFITKQPGHGEAAIIHVDETYLLTEPEGFVTGAWIALDNALEHNGCLEFVPGSHKKYDVQKKWIRKKSEHEPGKEWESILEIEGENPPLKDEDFVKVPVKSGGLVLLHGKTFHRSAENYSTDQRFVYTFHVFDGGKAKWSKLNWASERDDYKFLPLY